MNGPLLTTMLKSHAKSILSYTLGSTFYLLLIIYIYPSISQVEGLNDLIKSMPESLLKTFGIENGLSSLSDFIAGEYYGLLLLVLLSIFCILTSASLIAKLVDNGSMAYLLSTPASRMTVVLTQAVVGVIGLFIIIFITTACGIIVTKFFTSISDFDMWGFVKMNIVVFLLFFFISSYCFLCSSVCNDSKKAWSIPTAITLLFYGIDLIGKLSDKLESLRYASIFYYFNPIEIGRGHEDIFVTCLLFGIAGVLLYTISAFLFSKRDLPL
ncbi:hypothetical protein CHN50_04525 [Priestia aryabhattai]|uniref:ABC transporter permease subunit n=1 Tax=Priestia flexa TaxID=86664 RepID=UPI000BA08752|nr:hypothetical protein CHN50_04525 [Priestia aryabhattai]